MVRSTARKGHPSPAWRALAAQATGLMVAAIAGACRVALTGEELTTAQWLLVQAAAAGCTAACLRMPWWWVGLSLGFAPALALGAMLAMPPLLSACALAALLLVYGGTQRTRVPLFLSSGAAVEALRELLPRDRPFTLLDIGAGTGTALAAVARSHANVRVHGIERAPLPFLVAYLRSLACGRRYDVAWGNFWSSDLSGYDLVYAYLSPAPMPALWEKARREMRPGALLVSFSFVVPGVAPTRMIPAGQDWLYVWSMP